MTHATLDLQTARALGYELNPQDVEDSGMTIHEYVEALICNPYDGCMWVDDELLPIGNLEEAIEEAVRGYEARLED